MMTIIYIFTGAAVAALILFFYAQARQATWRERLRSKEEELKQACESRTRSEQQYIQKMDLLENRIQQINNENKTLTGQKAALEKEISLLRQQIDTDNRLRQKQFSEQLELVQQQLQNATRELLHERSQELAEANSVQMDAIISPLKESIRDMRAAMDSNRDTNNKNTASLEKAIEEIMKHTASIGQEADKLAHALRNETKTQGNWGELILDELLASQGLVEGIHYDKQATLRDASGEALLHEESGKRMIPDTILHYPDGKDAILDSKVSLKAFVDYQNAETEDERQEALGRHIRSIRKHIDELARKNYSAYIKPPRIALNYVIMFVPNESALQLALYNDVHLWRDAFEKGVFITSEQNLMAALRIIQIAWTQMQQAQNQEKIFDTARILLDRVADFTKYFDETGKKLQEAETAFTRASNKLRDGQQSILNGANKLIALGAKTSARKSLPNNES